MVVRKYPPKQAPEMPLYLAISRDEAARQIAERIKRGEDLKSRPMQNQPQFEEIQKQYWTWNEYNTEMLRQMFTTARGVRFSPALLCYSRNNFTRGCARTSHVH